MNRAQHKVGRNGPADGTAAAPSLTAADGGRDAGGRFTSGNRCSKGNANARRMAQLRAALFDGVTATQWAAVVQKLVLLATYGHLDAIKLLFLYCLGQPRRPDPDAADDEADSDEASKKQVVP
jgi:hypothetical protein